jgi:hypothetical protein
MKTLTTITAVILLAYVPAKAQAADAMISGAGLLTCTEYARMYQKDPEQPT